MAIGFGLDRSNSNSGVPSPWYRPQKPVMTPEAAFPRAIEQQAGDYDQIMQGYRNQMTGGNPEYGSLMENYRRLLAQNQGGPATHTYGETSQFNEAFGNAREISRTGGLSDAERADMRSRGVSPIRAAYQNANRNMARQARLGGGSANYNASIARMARQQGQSMADAMTNVNAGIAEMAQKGKLSAMDAMTRMGEGSSGRMNEVGMFNANAKNRHGENQANILSGMGSLMNAESNRKAEALRGMTSLYGTTPALVETFGGQVQRGQQMAAANPRQKRAGGGFIVPSFRGF